VDTERPAPGVCRAERLSDEGLKRLDKQLARGSRVAPAVLGQWIRRYGEPARAIIKRHGQYSDELDSPPAGSDPAPETSD
jgi:hypothetical protein